MPVFAARYIDFVVSIKIYVCVGLAVTSSYDMYGSCDENQLIKCC